MSHHEILKAACPNRAMDYTPWGTDERWADPTEPYPDCSHGCIHFYKLAKRGTEALGADWGVCTNPDSHRCGLLTFEHQGCKHMERRRSR